MEEKSGVQPQAMNIADYTRGQVEQVLRLAGIRAGGVETAAYSLKPGAPFRERRAEHDLALCVLQGMGTCELCDPQGNRLTMRLRRGTHFTVARGTGFRMANSGQALLIVLVAACPAGGAPG